MRGDWISHVRPLVAWAISAILNLLALASAGAQETELDEALDVDGSALHFTASLLDDGSASWISQSERTRDGIDAAAVDVSGVSEALREMTSDIEGPAKIRFFVQYNTDRDPGEAYFEFAVDGQAIVTRYGRIPGYEEHLIGIGAGMHQIAFRYVRTFSLASPQWLVIDNVEILPVGTGPPAIVLNPPALVDIGAGEALVLEAGAIDADRWQWRKGGVDLAGQTSPILVLPSAGAEDSGLYTLAAINDVGSVVSSTADVRVWSVSDLGEVLDVPGQAFSLSGDAAWAPTRGRADTGESAMRAPPLGPGQTAGVATTVDGPARLSWEWLTDCERNDDRVELLVDGAVVGSRSGPASVFFGGGTIILAAGEHELQWRYRKDGANSHYRDTVWLDHLQITPLSGGEGTSPPVITAQPWITKVSPRNSIDLATKIHPDSPQPVTFQWFRNDQPIPGASGPILPIHHTDPALHDGNYFVRIENPNGSTDSRTVELTIADHRWSDMVEWQRPPTTQNLSAIGPSPAGDKLWIYGDGVQLELGEAPELHRIPSIPGHSAILVGPGAVVRTQANGVQILESAGADKPVPLGSSGRIRAGRTSPDGTVWLCGENSSLLRIEDSTVTKIDVADPRPTTLTGVATDGDRVHLVGHSGPGSPLVAFSIDANSGAVRSFERGDVPRVNALAMRDDGRLIAACDDGIVCSYNPDDPGSFEMIDLGTGSDLNAIHCDGMRCFTGGDNGFVAESTGANGAWTVLPLDTTQAVLAITTFNGKVFGCGTGGLGFSGSGGGGGGQLDLLGSNNPRAIDFDSSRLGLATVGSDGSLRHNGRLLTTSSDIRSVDLSDSTITVAEMDRAEPIRLIDPKYGYVVAAGSGMGKVLLSETVESRFQARPSSGSVRIDVLITASGDIYCGEFPSTSLLEKENSRIGDGNHQFSHAIRVETGGIEESYDTAVILTANGLGFQLEVMDDGATKRWRPITTACPDITGGDAIRSLSVATDGSIVAVTNYGKLLSAASSGGDGTSTWSEPDLEDLEASGANLSYSSEQGHILSFDSGEVLVLGENLSPEAREKYITNGQRFDPRRLLNNTRSSVASTPNGGVGRSVPNATTPVEVPDVIGKPILEASRIFQDQMVSMLVVEQPSTEYPAGTVIWQSFPAGSEVAPWWDTPMEVYVSSGPPIKGASALSIEHSFSDEVIIVTWSNGSTLQYLDLSDLTWKDLPGASSPHKVDIIDLLRLYYRLTPEN